MRTLERHTPLDDRDRRELLALPYTKRTLDASTYLLREGDAPVQCGILLSGFAYRQKLTGDGGRQIVSLHVPGEPLDFQNLLLDEADHSLQTLTRAEIAYVPRTQFQNLFWTRPAIANALLIYILVEASIFREWVLNTTRRDARTRLAHILCEVGIRLDAVGLAEEYGYELPMSQEQLADMLGLTPVHVNRTLKALEREGLIERDRRRLRFPDWRRLRAVADFNPRYLHLAQSMRVTVTG